MREITGIIREIGDGTTTMRNIKYTRYSYIEIDTETIRKVIVYSGLDSKLSGAVGTGKVTLYMSFNYLVGIKMADGKTFRTAFPAPFFMKLGVPFFIILGVILVPFMGIGFFALYLAYKVWQVVKAESDSRKISGAIPL